MTKRDVGGMGESVLRKWAHERGAVINKAEYDRGGWDFLIEWEPVRRENRVPLDRQEGSLQCLVQVKATDSNARRRSVSLRNWHRFSTTALPAFYLVLEFSGKADCQAAFLRHHWERDIEETLKRLRTLDAAGIEDFSRKTRNLTWGSSDAIAPTSEALFGALERVIATSLADYSQKKAKLVKELGYDADVVQGVVKIRVPPEYRDRSPMDLWADFHLGLLPEMETTGATIWDTRFGIRSSKPLKEINTVGRIEGPKGKSGTVTMRRGFKTLSFTGSLFVSVPPGKDIDVKRSKARIQLSFTDLIFDYGTSDANVRFRLPRLDERRSVRDFSEWGKLVGFLSESPTDGTSQGIRVEVHGFYAGHLEVGGVKLDEDWIVLAGVSRSLGEIVARTDVAPERYVSARLLFEQKSQIDLIAVLMSGGIPNGRLSFDLDGEDTASPVSGPVAVPVLHWVRTLDELLVIPCVHHGNAVLESKERGSTLVIHIEHSQLKATHALPSETDPEDGSWNRWLDEIAEELGPEVQVVRWWDETFDPSSSASDSI